MTYAPRPTPILLALLLACAPALAQPTPSVDAPPNVLALPVEPGLPALPARVTLPELLELVRWRNPTLAAERVRIDAARADLITAGTLPNPTFSAARQRGTPGEPSEREVAIEQPLPIFGQRGLRQENARLGIRTTQAQRDAAVAETLRSAAKAFVGLQIAQERERSWRAAEADFGLAARIVIGQVEAGARSRYERTRIEVETAAIASHTEELQAATAEAAAQLAVLVGMPGWRPAVAERPALPPVLPGTSALWLQAQERLPTVRAALAEEAQARQRIEVERREAWPVPAIGVGRLRDGEGRHNIIGVSVTIPLFDRNQGPIARARAEADEQRLRREAVLREAEAELQRAADQYQRRRQLAERYERQAMALLPELRRMAQDAYTLGSGGILEFIDALQAVSERQTAYLDLLEAALQADLDLQAASGAFGRSEGAPG
ncbi:TolC family protein [Xylophilus sp. GW821-FHT01B05]